MGLLEDMTPVGEMGSEIVHDRGADVVAERMWQDCEPVLKHNEAIRNYHDEPFFEDRSFVLAARIPMVIVNKWLIEEGINVLDPADREKVMAKLDDPDWAKLKTWDGKLSKRPGRAYFTTS